jgi:hypothetical protein
MAQKAKRTIWIASQTTAHHRSRAIQLETLGFHVQFVKSLSEFEQRCEQFRPSTIILDTHTDRDQTKRYIHFISTNKTLAPTRTVLSLIEKERETCADATSANFRDIIPWDLTDDAWISRIKYATAAKPVDMPEQYCAISMNQPSVLHLSGRLVWIDETHARIEYRGKQTPGSLLTIKGTLAKLMGVDHITMTVDSVHRTQLHYRYSYAVICQWRVADSAIQRATEFVRRLKQERRGPRYRAFLAIQNSGLRKKIIDQFNQGSFEVNVALQRNQLPLEIQYFSPDLVIFDDKVISSLSDDELLALTAPLAKDIAIIVIGKEMDRSSIDWILKGRTIYYEETLTDDFFKTPEERYRVSQHERIEPQDLHRTYLASNHPCSYLDVELVARLKSLSPTSGMVALSIPMSSFVLARLEAPILKRALGRDVFVKIKRSYESNYDAHQPQFSNYAEFILSDVTHEESKILAKQLLTTTGEYFKSLGLLKEPNQTNPINLIKEAREIREIRDVKAITATPAILTPVLTPQAPTLESLTTETTKDHEKPDEQKIPSEAPEKSSKTSKIMAKKSKPFDLSDYIDPVIAKALGVFVIASIIMGFILYAASNVDEDFYKDSGKQYSDFFIRMRDAEPMPRPQKPSDPK